MLGQPITWESYFVVRFGFAFILIALLFALFVIGMIFALFQAAWEDHKAGKEDGEPRAGKTLFL
jgi:hypothetical protein